MSEPLSLEDTLPLPDASGDEDYLDDEYVDSQGEQQQGTT
jgi:hypothetical protein